MTDISKERRAEMRRKTALAVDFGWDVDGVDPYDLLALLDAADERDRLREALISALTGGNHLATVLLGHEKPIINAGTSHEDALAYYGPGDTYEVWCCWRAIMVARWLKDSPDAPL